MRKHNGSQYYWEHRLNKDHLQNKELQNDAGCNAFFEITPPAGKHHHI
jgi:hypothetical protein